MPMPGEGYLVSLWTLAKTNDTVRDGRRRLAPVEGVCRTSRQRATPTGKYHISLPVNVNRRTLHAHRLHKLSGFIRKEFQLASSKLN